MHIKAACTAANSWLCTLADVDCLKAAYAAVTAVSVDGNDNICLKAAFAAVNWNGGLKMRMPDFKAAYAAVTPIFSASLFQAI